MQVTTLGALGTSRLLAGCAAVSSPSGRVDGPVPVDTGEYRVGAFRCPLWSESNRPGCWDAVKKFPEREPVIGWYDEADPAVIDQEITFAVEHGISFFIECWFRKKDNLGRPPEYVLGHWLDALPQARYRDRIRFMIMWENLNGIASGVASEEDLLENLVPFWIEEYFRRPNYLVIDNRPVFMIYGYERFVDELGGPENAARAVTAMRRACVDAGFDGLWLMAEYHGHFREPIPLASEVGFDAITSYHWPSFSGLMPRVPDDTREIAPLQEQCWEGLKQVSGLPTVPTVSMGWDSEPWGRSYYKGQWYIEPEVFGQLCERAQVFLADQPPELPFARTVILDNWNEYGEGHYIFPTRRFGFAYLEAVRHAFSPPACR
jgi:hypothetical protein